MGYSYEIRRVLVVEGETRGGGHGGVLWEYIVVEDYRVSKGRSRNHIDILERPKFSWL